MASQQTHNRAVQAGDRIRLRIRWERRDRHRIVTVVALGLAAVVVAMALVGLPPINLNGPLSSLGITCPLCGGTRSARFTAQGQLAEAWRYNPLGIVVVLASIALVARAAIGVVGRRWMNLSVDLSPRARFIMIAAVVTFTVLLGIRQQLQADLLLGGA